MTNPPENWRKEAKAKQQAAWAEVQKLTIFTQRIRIALETGDYEGYCFALMEYDAKGSEP